METLYVVLFPIIAIQQQLIDVFVYLTNSIGISIILLSLAIYSLTRPLIRMGEKIEQNHKKIQDSMVEELRYVKSHYKGEAQFNEIERIYKAKNYHPIQSLKSAASLAVQIPFLLSSMLMLLSYQPLVGESFGFLTDLSKPDMQFGSVNVLPFLMAGITLLESIIKQDMTFGEKIKFNIITLVVIVLIYNLPSAIVLYWMTNNLVSLARTGLRATL